MIGENILIQRMIIERDILFATPAYSLNGKPYFLTRCTSSVDLDTTQQYLQTAITEVQIELATVTPLFNTVGGGGLARVSRRAAVSLAQRPVHPTLQHGLRGGCRRTAELDAENPPLPRLTLAEPPSVS